MAQNIQALIDLLGESVLEVDLSFISSRGIVEGDLNHIGKFLEVILEVIVHLAQEQGEGEEEEEEPSPEKPKAETPPDFYGGNQPTDKQVLIDDDLEEPKIEDEPIKPGF